MIVLRRGIMMIVHALVSLAASAAWPDKRAGTERQTDDKRQVTDKQG